MTEATMTIEVLEESEERPKEKAIEKKSKTDDTLKRLTVGMSGGENKGKFILGTIIRFFALLALVFLPFITGQAMNIINEGGSTEELWQWVRNGVIVGVIFLVLSFLADRTFANLATKALYKLQTDLFKNIQTLFHGLLLQNAGGRALEPDHE
jgi:ABC-type multidrug transport system fused ATPase/permease subunit